MPDRTSIAARINPSRAAIAFTEPRVSTSGNDYFRDTRLDVHQIEARIFGRHSLKRQSLGQHAVADVRVQTSRLDQIDVGLQCVVQIRDQSAEVEQNSALHRDRRGNRRGLPPGFPQSRPSRRRERSCTRAIPPGAEFLPASSWSSLFERRSFPNRDCEGAARNRSRNDRKHIHYTHTGTIDPAGTPAQALHPCLRAGRGTGRRHAPHAGSGSFGARDQRERTQGSRNVSRDGHGRLVGPCVFREVRNQRISGSRAVSPHPDTWPRHARRFPGASE